MLFSTLLVTSCTSETVVTKNSTIIENEKEDNNFDYVLLKQQDVNMTRTSVRANHLDMETPLRCKVNWQKQEMVQILPHNDVSFNFERNDINDDLPELEVRNFDFDNMPAEKALVKLAREADIKLVAKDAPYPTLYGKNISGNFDDVVEMIANSADLFYRYEEKSNSIILSRNASFTLHIPHSRTLLLGFLDVLRGAGITDMITNWRDYTITFETNRDTIKKIKGLVKEFENNPTMIMYDVSVFRAKAKEPCGIVWNDLIKDFDFNSIATTQEGIIGRMLTVTNDISINQLKNFVEKYADIKDVSEGRFVVPGHWFSRFDVGRCGDVNSIEYPLSVLAKASIEKSGKIVSEITLDTTDGEVTKFKARNNIGENFLIIGVPSEIFGKSEEGSETIVFIVPRLVRLLKTDEKIKNKI